MVISGISMSSLCELLARSFSCGAVYQDENLLDATVRSAAMPRLARLLTQSWKQGCEFSASLSNIVLAKMTASYRAVPPHDVSTSGSQQTKLSPLNETVAKRTDEPQPKDSPFVRGLIRKAKGRKRGQGQPANLSFKPQLGRQNGTSFAVEAYVTARPQLAEMTVMICTEMLNGAISAIVILVITISYL